MKIADNKTYKDVHLWLQNNYGSADRCSAKGCEGKSDKFEWALRHGKEYEKMRRNFRKMCVPCHRAYDSDFRMSGGIIPVRHNYKTLRVTNDIHQYLRDKAFYENTTFIQILKEAFGLK